MPTSHSENLILDTDSYKSSHWLQYPPGTKAVFNYLESRGGQYDKTVFFGLQYLLKRYLTTPVTKEDVEEAATFFKAHGLPFNFEGWMGIVTEHGGRIPMRIKALPEGTVTETGIPLLTCESTDPRFFWVVGWFETMVMRIWYPTTVATLSFHMRKVLKDYLVQTSDSIEGLPFKLHDFGSRGVSSRESAAIGGAAHLVNFMGSDTVAGVEMANRYYGAGMAGFSIPAAEHSTITSWGRKGEVEAYENMLAQFARPGSILAVVSDSYDVFDAANHLWGETLRQKVIDSGATLVIRPDSGDPVTVVNQLLHILEARFGSVRNSKGYRLLNHVRLIQGDGCNPYTIECILKSTKLAGFSTDNLAFGMGGGLLQQVNRDTQKFAYKLSAIEREYGEPDGMTVTRWEDVFKDPVTDPGKKSKRGRLGTRPMTIGSGHIVTTDEDVDNILRPVYENGRLLVDDTFAAIRERAQR